MHKTTQSICQQRRHIINVIYSVSLTHTQTFSCSPCCTSCINIFLSLSLTESESKSGVSQQCNDVVMLWCWNTTSWNQTLCLLTCFVVTHVSSKWLHDFAEITQSMSQLDESLARRALCRQHHSVTHNTLFHDYSAFATC